MRGDGIVLSPPLEQSGDIFARFAFDFVVDTAAAANDVFDGVFLLLRFLDATNDDLVSRRLEVFPIALISFCGADFCCRLAAFIVGNASSLADRERRDNDSATVRCCC